jgi:hypothetical protein
MQVSGTGTPSVEDILGTNITDSRLIRHPDGRVEIEANGQADQDLAMNAVERIGVMAHEPSIQQAIRDAPLRAAQAVALVAATPSASKIPTLPIGQAVAQWLADIKPNTLRKNTLSRRHRSSGLPSITARKIPCARPEGLM